MVFFLRQKSNLESLRYTVGVLSCDVILILDPTLESKLWIPDFPAPQWITDPRREINRAGPQFSFKVKIRVGAS